MERRDLLKTAGILAAAAVARRLAPASWARAANALAPVAALDDAQLSLITAIADTLIPRTTTPGAIDVGVPAFVNAMVSESFTAHERNAFISGLTVVEVHLRDGRGRAFFALDHATRAARLEDIEDSGVAYRAVSRLLRHGEPRRTYWQLKELIVHGYFTSQVVADDILGDPMIPGTFNGAAPLRHA